MLLIAGKLVVDEIFRCAVAPLPGTAQRAVTVQVSGGGQVWHTARAAKADSPDLAVAVIGWRGDDASADQVFGLLRAQRVDGELRPLPQGSTAVVLVAPDGERTIVSRPHVLATRLPVDALALPVPAPSWVHLDGYDLGERSGDAMVRLALSAAEAGIRLSLEPPSPAGLPVRLPWLRSLPPLQLLSGRPDEIAALLPELSAPPTAVVEHDGPRPVVVRLSRPRASFSFDDAASTESFPAIGAGDRFTGGMLAAICQAPKFPAVEHEWAAVVHRGKRAAALAR